MNLVLGLIVLCYKYDYFLCFTAMVVILLAIVYKELLETMLGKEK